MGNKDNVLIGQRIKELRKGKGYSQQGLADLLGKSLRTIQKYESGEIEISIAMINEIAKKLETTSTYLLGYEQGETQLNCMSDIMGFFFMLEKIVGLHFDIDVKRPPHFDEWQCSIVFNGKDTSARHNADICLFLERWKQYREDVDYMMISRDKYREWQDRSLAYHMSTAVETEEPEEMDEFTRSQKRNELFSQKYGKTSEE